MSENSPFFVETRVLTFSSGETVELQVTREFLDRVRKRFGTQDHESVDDALIKAYLSERARTALERMDDEDGGTG